MSESYRFLSLADNGDGVLHITLCSGHPFNTFSQPMMRELEQCLTNIDHSQHRVVVMRGHDGLFSAGLNLKSRYQFKDAGPDNGLDFMRTFGKAVSAVHGCASPVIAVLEGVVAGGALSLAAAADIRIATQGCRFVPAFQKLGLSGSEMGLSYLLPRLIGHSSAAEIILTGREFDADEAQRLQFVSYVESPESINDRLSKLLQAMLQTSVLGLRLSKSSLCHSLYSVSLLQTIEFEARNQVLCFQDGLVDKAVQQRVNKQQVDLSTPDYPDIEQTTETV